MTIFLFDKGLYIMLYAFKLYIMKYYWTMKDGKKIDVDNMTESHLRNVLKTILRNRRERIEDAIKFEHEENLWK